MMKVHELTLSAKKFNDFLNVNYMIMEINDIQAKDYILFKEIERDEEGNTHETERHKMVRVEEILQDDGFKEGYGLIMFTELR